MIGGFDAPPTQGMGISANVLLSAEETWLMQNWGALAQMGAILQPTAAVLKVQRLHQLHCDHPAWVIYCILGEP